MVISEKHGQQQLGVVETPNRHVHFVDTTTVHSEDKTSEAKTSEALDVPRRVPPRSMVAAGRQVLQRNILASSSPQDAIIRLELSPKKSAERRHKLCQRLTEQLNESNDDVNII